MAHGPLVIYYGGWTNLKVPSPPPPGSYILGKKKRNAATRFFYFTVVFFFKTHLKFGNLKRLFLPFSNSLLINSGVNQRPVSKSMSANLITVLCFRYCCAASIILTSTVPVTIGVRQ